MDKSTLALIGAFATAFAVSATSGIAAYLRTNKPITPVALVSAGLNSGLLGLGMSLLWSDKMKDNPYFILGVCVITGLTGAAGFDFILTAIQKGGLQIKFGSGEDKLDMDFGISEKEKQESKSEKNN